MPPTISINLTISVGSVIAKLTVGNGTYGAVAVNAGIVIPTEDVILPTDDTIEKRLEEPECCVTRKV